MTGIFLSIVAALAQALGGYIVMRREHWPKKWEAGLLALSAGFLLALTFIDLIPHSFELTQKTEWVTLSILIGFSTLHFFEHTVVEHMHFGEETHSHGSHQHVSLFGALGGLGIHAVFDGMTIASAAAVREELGILVFVAVLLHKIPEGLTVASILRSQGLSKKSVRTATMLLPAATLLGALLVTVFISFESSLVGFFFAFSAGSAVYVGAADLIPEVNRSRGRLAPLLVFLGMILFWLGEHLLATFVG